MIPGKHILAAGHRLRCAPFHHAPERRNWKHILATKERSPSTSRLFQTAPSILVFLRSLLQYLMNPGIGDAVLTSKSWNAPTSLRIAGTYLRISFGLRRVVRHDRLVGWGIENAQHRFDCLFQWGYRYVLKAPWGHDAPHHEGGAFFVVSLCMCRSIS